MKPWKEKKRRKQISTKLFDVYEVAFQSPLGKEGDFDVLESPDWVNVVAVNSEDKVIMVRQFRFGIGELTLEFPAGKVDPGEETRQTAIRELQEESGASIKSIEKTGQTQANPAFLNNYCHHFLAKINDSPLQANPQGHEELEAVWMSVEEIDKGIKNGTISHSLSICAWYYFKLAKRD